MATLVAAQAALANDSTAVLAGGGLQLTVNSGIAMLAEDLRISVRGIDISYAFQNNADAPVTTLVAFPLPTLRAGAVEITGALPRENDPLNYVGFSISVDEQPVRPSVEQRASVLGVDITDRLKADGVPLNPFVQDGARAALAALPADKRAFYVRNGLAVWSDGAPLSVQWDVATSFYWQQTFPARKVIKIQHRYVPVSGAAPMTAADLTPAAISALRTRYCISDADFDRVRGWLGGGGRRQEQARLRARRAVVEYVLSTGANWAGPIGDFRLTVEPPAPDSVVAFCVPAGLTKGPRGSYEAKDFIPASDLAILFVSKSGQE